jgi:CheY-like chemotaxis protein
MQIRQRLNPPTLIRSDALKGTPHVDSVNQVLQQITDPNLTREERAQLRCQLSKEMESTGNFRAAREALGEWWKGSGQRPNTDDLSQWTAAELLLRVGVLTGRIGSAGQVENAQEQGKNLISESLSKFAALRDWRKVAEAQVELGTCYWREGAFDEARVMLREALERLTDEDGELKALGLLRLAMVDTAAFRLNDALRVLAGAAHLFERSDNQNLKGSFHNEYAMLLRRLGEVERRDEYTDRALIEYAAASFHFEQAGNARYQACVENNLGFLFSTIGRFEEAHGHLDYAQALFKSLNDLANMAQVDETRARIFLAEGKYTEAERLVRRVVEALGGGGEQSLLAEALTTHGTALARIGRDAEARHALCRAVEVAERAGDAEGAGQAALTLIEELGDSLTPEDLHDTYERAHALLSSSQHPGSQERLLRCARDVVARFGVSGGLPQTWENFSFDRAVRGYEARLIERALRDGGGVVSRAAHMLGLKRQRLSRLLRTRHKRLRSALAPAAPRRARAIGKVSVERSAPTVSILYAEDRREVSDAVSESLELEGWRVEVCTNGLQAEQALRGGGHFDALIFDHDLPGMTGVELTRLTRSLAHRRRTPIIVFTAAEVECEARHAGADAFLRKPHDVFSIAETVTSLLARDRD